MKRLLLLALLLLSVPALAQVSGGGVTGLVRGGPPPVAGNCTKWLTAGSIGDAGSTCGGTGAPAAPAYGIGYNNNGAWGSLLPGSTGTYCFNWSSLVAAPTLTGSCGGGGSAFSALTSGTNTTAAMIVGTGGSLTISGSGTINATTLGGAIFASPGAIGSTTASTGAFTTLSASSTVSGTGFSTYLASPPAIGGTAAAAGAFTTLSASSTVSGTGFSNYLASPPAIGGSAAAAASFTTLNLSGNLTTNVTGGGTQCAQVSNTGVLSGTGAGCAGAPAFSAITAGTNTVALVVGTGGTLNPSGTGVINADQVNGAAVPTSAALTATNGSAQFTAVSTGNGLAIASAVLATTAAIDAQTGTSYTISCTTDPAHLVTFSNASAIAVTLPQATGSCAAGFGFDVENKGAGLVTITPTTSTINGNSTLTVSTGTGCSITSDGTNYQVSACTALVPGTVTSVAETVPTGFTVSGSPVTTSGTLAVSFSGPVVGGTKFTQAPTGCTPSATTGGATAGTITLAAGPCTSIVITMNGATGLTAPTGWSCNVHDRTASTIPAWGETASSTTTATIPVPTAAGATDVLSFNCTGF